MFLGTAVPQASRYRNSRMVPIPEDEKVLKAGSTLDPAGLAALMGIDITTEQPLLHTIEHIGAMIEDFHILVSGGSADDMTFLHKVS